MKKAKPKMRTVLVKMNQEDYVKAKALAQLWCGGNLSALIRYALKNAPKPQGQIGPTRTVRERYT